METILWIESIWQIYQITYNFLVWLFLWTIDDKTKVLNVQSKNTLSTETSLSRGSIRTVENHYAFLVSLMHDEISCSLPLHLTVFSVSFPDSKVESIKSRYSSSSRHANMCICKGAIWLFLGYGLSSLQ